MHKFCLLPIAFLFLLTDMETYTLGNLFHICKYYCDVPLQLFLSKLHKLSYVSFSFFLYILIHLLHFVLLISPRFLNCDAQTHVLSWALLTVHLVCNSLQLPMPYAKTEILHFYSYSWFLPKGNHLHLSFQLADFRLFLQIKKKKKAMGENTFKVL